MSSKFSNKIKYLVLAIALVSAFFLLAMPSPADALPGTGLFDLFKAQLDAIEEKAGPISLVLIIMFFVYAKSLALLWVSTEILDRVIWLNREMVEIGGPMVTYGWEFVSGLANMFLILIFIALAFSLILKIGGWEVKKILPRLIIVALLLNFSLVFIGMLIDIANIAYSTFLPPPGENLMGTLMGSFLQSGVASVAGQAAAIIATTAIYMVPFSAPYAQFVLVLGVVGIVLPFLITLFFQIIIFISLTGMFFLYVFIFGIRIFIIQILAILSPLAFLCLILPQTKTYWDMWVKWLLSWLFAGIFLLFFLRLGFLIFGFFKEELAVGAIPWFHNLGAYFMFYLFVFIYLGITSFLAKRFMPEFAQAAIETVKGITKSAAVVGGGALLLRSLKQQAAETEVAQETAIDEAEKKKSRGEKLTRGEEAILSPLNRKATNVVKWMYRVRGTTAQREEEKLAREDAKRFEGLAVSDPEALNKKNIGSPEQHVARAIALIDAGNAHKVNNEDAAEIIKLRNPALIKAIAPNYHKQMGAGISFEEQRRECENLPETTKEEETIKKEERQRINIAERITNNLSGKGTEEDRREEAVQKTFPTKGEKIENIKPTIDLVRTMINFDIPTHQIANFARIHGSEFANVFAKELRNMQAKEGGGEKGAEIVAENLIKNRLDLVRYITTCPTTELEFPEEIKKVLERIIAKKKPP